MVVDDEPAVLGTTADLLNNIGYVVLQAIGGAPALKLLESEPVNLLLTDIVMAPMSGPELARRVEELRPGLPVVSSPVMPGQLVSLVTSLSTD